MSPKASKKVLRLGLAQDNRFLEEHFVRSPEDITLGRSLDDNTLVAPASDLPPSLELFKYRNGRFYLRITDEVTGQIRVNSETHSLQRFIDQGKAKKHDGAYLLPLPLNAEGRIQIGDVTIFFQFVTPPASVDKPKLPKALKGGWTAQIEPYLFMMLTVSAVLQAGFVIWLLSQDFPEPKTVSKQVSDRFVEVMKKKEDKPDKEEPPEPEKQEEKEKTKQAKQAKPKNTETKPKPEPEKPDKDLSKKEQRRKKMVEKVEKKTVLSQIGAGSGDDGVVDQLTKVDSGAMDDAFAGSEGMTTDPTEGNDLRTSGTADAQGSGKSAGIGDLEKTSATKEAEQAGGTGEATQERQVQANIDVGSETQVDKAKGVLDPAAVSRVIKNKYGTLRSCYVQYLNTNPEAAGKIEIKFKINPRGRVTTSSATTNTVGGTVGACVARKIKRWRFPKPKGGTITFRKTFVFEASR